MSAPSLLTGPPQTFATAYSRTQRHAQPTGIDANAHADVATYTGALDAIDRLALSLADLCRTAVDPLAIVAGLEAEGFNDRTARDRYGLPDLFDLAEELHRRVPRDLGRAGSPSAPPPTGTARAILRGLLFATPSLCAMTFLVTNVGGAGRALLACVQILAWGYGQGIAHVAYGRLNNADRAAASRVLRMGTSHSLLASAALLGAMELTLGTPPAALLPAATSLWFCLAAIPALVLGAEFRLAATLVPVTVGAIAAWLSASDGVALIGSQLSVAATVLTMLHLTRTSTTPTAGPTSSPRPRPRPKAENATNAPGRLNLAAGLTRGELRDALPHILSGLATGALITVVLAGPAASGRGLVALHAAIVLTLGMGAGEWHARWYQRRVSSLLSTLADPALFASPATMLLLTALLRQVATTAVLASAGYFALDRGHDGSVGLYLYALALAPGLLAALFLRGIDANAALWPLALALAATVAALPGHNTAALAAIAAEASVLLTIRAARATARPWVHL